MTGCGPPDLTQLGGFVAGVLLLLAPALVIGLGFALTWRWLTR